MGFFGRVANLVKGGVKVATRRAPDDDRAAREAALDAELRARGATPRPSASPKADPSPKPEPAASPRSEPAAPPERDGEGNVKRRL